MAQCTFNLTEGSVSFAFTPEAAQDLNRALDQLLVSLKAIAAAATPGIPSKPNPQATMEFQHVGEVFLEVFCNPNIWPTPFAAKVLITLRDDRLRLSTEAGLTQLRDDLRQFLEQAA
ncbi:MAG: hypothetical protein AAGF24_15220 [Cyanobacteria bacterium P01_H01_bin.121]